MNVFSTKQRIVVSLLLAVAIVGLVYAFQSAREPEQEVVQRDARVAAVYPKDGDIGLRQDTIYADLVFPYTGTLSIDGIPIEEPQLKRFQVGGATRLAYTPGPATVTGYLKAGTRHTAVVRFWKPEEGPEKASEFGWSFEIR